MKDYYELLGLPEKADFNQIRERYRRLVTSCHPDKFQDAAQKMRAEERVKEINEAYYVLRDPVRRSKYDRQRGSATSRQGVQVQVRPQSKSKKPPVQPVRPAVTVHPSRTRPFSAPQFLHRAFQSTRGDFVRVWLDRRANVLLLDEENMGRYHQGMEFDYYGGYARYSPVDIAVPYKGHWHLVVDLGGVTGILNVRAEIVRSRWWWG